LNCELLDREDCVNELRSEVSSVPELATAEMKRLQPELDCEKRKWQEQVKKERDQIKKDMEKMQQDMEQHGEEMKEQMKQWIRDADI